MRGSIIRVGFLLPFYVYLCAIFPNANKTSKTYKIAPILHECRVCGLSFKKTNDYNVHIAGRKHAEALVTYISPEEVWRNFLLCHWSKGTSLADVSTKWSMDELSSLNLKYRTSCLHPSPTVGKLTPFQRARLWMYIRETMGPHFPELGNILAAVDLDDEGHLRVKELFENIEAFKVISRFIIAANRTLLASSLTAHDSTNTSLRTNNASSIEPSTRLDSIVELAGGHGLLSVLLAYRFPQLQVTCYDLLKRPTFEAFIRAFETHGLKRPGLETVLPNIEFREQDMREAVDLVTEKSIVVCLHGCGEVNEMAIELAREKRAGWIVMPCCIKKGQYLHPSCQVLVSDEARYSVLCGALANAYQAQAMVGIDDRITNRPILISGGIGAESDQQIESTARGSDQKGDDLLRAVRTRSLPKLQFH